MTQHGDVLEMTERERVEAETATCDWGDCDQPVTAYRYDAPGHGWLPVCADCAQKTEYPQ